MSYYDLYYGRKKKQQGKKLGRASRKGLYTFDHDHWGRPEGGGDRHLNKEMKEARQQI